jgi:toxin ParE1/3/4
VKLSLTRRARAERNAILDYVGGRSTQGMHRLADAFEDAFGLISDHPEAGEMTRREGVRSIPLTRYPYRVFYAVRRAGISVLHIRHTSRTPWKDPPA